MKISDIFRNIKFITVNRIVGLLMVGVAAFLNMASQDSLFLTIGEYLLFVIGTLIFSAEIIKNLMSFNRYLKLERKIKELKMSVIRRFWNFPVLRFRRFLGMLVFAAGLFMVILTVIYHYLIPEVNLTGFLLTGLGIVIFISDVLFALFLSVIYLIGKSIWSLVILLQEFKLMGEWPLWTIIGTGLGLVMFFWGIENLIAQSMNIFPTPLEIQQKFFWLMLLGLAVMGSSFAIKIIRIK